MSYLLHIETATEVCSVCISEEDRLLAIEELKDHNAHAAQITRLIEACCRGAGIGLAALGAVSVSSGPGSYTSLRVGTSAAKGICFAFDIPLISVDTLQALAVAASAKAPKGVQYFCPMIDARRMEVYASIFDKVLNNIQNTHNLIVEKSSFSALFPEGGMVAFCGNGAEKCKAVIRHPKALFLDVVCSSRHLPALAWVAYQRQDFVDTASYAPHYYKEPNITRPKNIL